MKLALESLAVLEVIRDLNLSVVVVVASKMALFVPIGSAGLGAGSRTWYGWYWCWF
jgi:hypothetical protein